MPHDPQRPTTIENDAPVEPAHPAPAQSPRPLGSDGLPERRNPAADGEQWERDHHREEKRPDDATR